MPTPVHIIYTMLYHAGQDFSSLPLSEQEAFLCPAEREKLATLRFPKRREEWLLGRWTAKQLLRGSQGQYASLGLQEIEIGNMASGAPFLKFPGSQTFAGTLTISHTHHRAFCALTFDPDLKIGADIERIEARTPGFCEDYFTPGEVRQRDIYPVTDQDTWVNLVWSAKESMLKALGKGLRIDTRQVEILPVENLEQKVGNQENSQAPWGDLQVRCHLAETLHWSAWWQRQDEFVCTLAALSNDELNPRSVLLQEVA